MKRIIFDTSVYGELVLDKKLTFEIAKHLQKDFIVYGNKTIRDELKKTSKDKKLGNRKLRILLLGVYDSFVRKENYKLKITELVELIANKYYKAYKEFKGNISYNKIINDFKIVACASLHNLDIVISHDERSMLSDKLIKAYKKVNVGYQLRTPEFILYIKFKRWFSYDD